MNLYVVAMGNRAVSGAMDQIQATRTLASVLLYQANLQSLLVNGSHAVQTVGAVKKGLGKRPGEAGGR